MVAGNTRSGPVAGQDVRARSREYIVESPFTSVTVLFGLGVGVGFILGHTVAESTGRHMMHQDTFTEKLTCQIRDVLKNNLPQGLLRHISQ